MPIDDSIELESTYPTTAGNKAAALGLPCDTSSSCLSYSCVFNIYIYGFGMKKGLSINVCGDVLCAIAVQGRGAHCHGLRQVVCADASGSQHASGQ
eukprot:gene28594-37780_t